MRQNSLMHKFILFSVAVVCIFAVQYFLTLQPVRAAELYERKSILFVTILTPGAVQIPEDKLSQLMTAIEEIKISKFDYNTLPKSLRTHFPKSTNEYCSKILKKLDSIEASIKQVEDPKRKLDLLNRKKEEEKALFQQISLLNKPLTQTLIRILRDHDLQKLRAHEYTSEEERKRFIVTKAKEFGITSEDLEKVMNSAYLCVVILTGYSKPLTKTVSKVVVSGKKMTAIRVTNKQLAARIIWFKFVNLEKNPDTQFRQIARIQASVESDFNPEDYSPEMAFKGAVKEFVAKLGLKTRGIEEIVEVKGNKIWITLGKREELYVGQKFLVYQNHKKKGSFYVNKIGDNVSNRDELSSGTLIVPGAEPGMQIRMLPGYYLDVGFRHDTAEVDSVKSSVSINPLNVNANYDHLGRLVKIPHLFFTVGIGIGIGSSDFGNWSYWDIYLGCLKKYYIHRFALYFEPLIQTQSLSIETSPFLVVTNTASSLSSNIGVEFALTEDLSVGTELNIRLYGSSDESDNFSKVSFGVHLTKNVSKKYLNPAYWP